MIVRPLNLELLDAYQTLIWRANSPIPGDAERLKFIADRLGLSPAEVCDDVATAVLAKALPPDSADAARLRLVNPLIFG